MGKGVSIAGWNHTSKPTQQALLDDICSIDELTNCNQPNTLALRHPPLVAWSAALTEGFASSAVYTLCWQQLLLKRRYLDAIGSKHTSRQVLGSDQLVIAKGDNKEEACHGTSCNASFTQKTASKEESSTWVGKCQGSGHLHLLNGPPERRMFASRCLILLFLRI